MGLEEVIWRVEAGVADRKDEWRRTRRLCYYQARIMVGFKGTEEDLWQIDHIEKTEPAVKIKDWSAKLKQMGKL
jgi:hypothetical protein